MLRLRHLSWAVLAASSLGFAACSASDSDSIPGPGPDARIFAPPEPRLTRLLERQYVNSVGHLLGSAARQAASPPPDAKIQGFTSIASTQLALNDSLVAEYELSARAIAAAAMTDHHHVASFLASCDPKGSDEDCFRLFAKDFGRLAFRRPLTGPETDAYVNVATEAKKAFADFYIGIETTISTMLQSPNFLYRVELGEPSADGKSRKLTAHEVASRMSFFLLDTTPSAALLTAAENGKLDGEDRVRAVAAQLLDEPDAKQATAAFFAEYLAIDDMEEVTKDPQLYPNFSPALASSMKRETLELVNDVVWRGDLPIDTLFTAEHSFVDEALATHYDIDLDGKKDWSRVTLPAEQKRSGLLTHASIMSRQSHPTSTSVTHRGLFIMERFLCQSMPPPPPEAVTELPPTSTAPTMRERLAVHLENPTCAACHTTSDNLGLALENFDAVGIFRTKENGSTIDTTVELDSFGSFDGPAELGQLLAAQPAVKACVLRHLFRHATGRIETNGDLAALDSLNERFAESGYRFKQLLVDLVASQVFSDAGSFEP